MATPAPNWIRNHAHWQLIGSPLRPAVEDIGLYQKALDRWCKDFGSSAAKVLLLGVTQELRTLAWPVDTDLLACDNSSIMIEMLWPGITFPGKSEAAIRADWRSLPLGSGTRNMVIGDGSLTLLSPDALKRLSADLDRILDDDAALILRLFVRPAQPEDLRSIADSALSGDIDSFNALKWRLAMSIQGRATSGAVAADVWDAFASLFPDRAALSARTGWPLEVIDTIDAYRGSKAVFFFHRLDELDAILRPSFRVVSIDYPAYELGECCPVIAAYRSR